MARLTPTQRFILEVANGHERGLVRFTAGDRKGTRRVGYSEGVSIICAYMTPEFFLKARGLLEPYGNERHVYRITAAGRAAVAPNPGKDLCPDHGAIWKARAHARP